MIPLRHSTRFIRIGAFTLVEVLVVVAIVGVLMALIVAGVGKARDSANRAKSMANLRNLSAGLTAYMGESNMTLDLFAGGGGNSQNNYARNLHASGTIPDKAVFFSPYFGRSKSVAQRSDWDFYVSYGINAAFPASLPTTGGNFKINYITIENPSSYPLLASTFWPRLPNQLHGRFNFYWSSGAGTPGLFYERDYGVIAAFLDGHMAPVGEEELKAMGFRGAYQWNGKDATYTEF